MYKKLQYSIIFLSTRYKKLNAQLTYTVVSVRKICKTERLFFTGTAAHPKKKIFCYLKNVSIEISKMAFCPQDGNSFNCCIKSLSVALNSI